MCWSNMTAMLLIRSSYYLRSVTVETVVLLSKGEIDSNMYQRSELDYLICNDPMGYADLVLNGNPETYLKTVTEYKPLDS